MKIYLVRHGESIAAADDQTRPLSKKGKEDINAIAKFISHYPIEVANLFHSGKTRAMQTAELLLPSVTLRNPMEERADELDPMAPLDRILAELYATDQDAILVGHMPFMGRLIGKLVVGDERVDVVAFKAGAMVCLEQLEREHWIICWMLTPSLFNTE